MAKKAKQRPEPGKATKTLVEAFDATRMRYGFTSPAVVRAEMNGRCYDPACESRGTANSAANL